MRITTDSMGDMPVPDDALWGASTERAVRNFPISGYTMPAALIRALGLIKLAAATVNEDLGRLTPEKSRLIQRAAREIADGLHLAQFPVDVFQSGSATSTNTNANEVIVARAAQLAVSAAGAAPELHPNDDVNLSQSSNDVIPSALHISVVQVLRADLAPALAAMASTLEAKSVEFAGIVKIGRTHLMDATPLTLGQEFSGYAAQLRKAGSRVERATAVLAELAIGGTAVGTGINAPPEFGTRVCRVLADETGFPFHEARNHFEAQGSRDDCVEVAGHLAAVAASLTKVANDIRLLASGPRAGLAELRLPATQPGSSIMPGKVNPVMSEMLVQVGLYVQALTHAVTACGREGHLELNATLPVMAHALHESIRCLANGARAFTEKCLVGLEADAERCEELTTRSLMLVTALTPTLGYDVAADVAKDALASGASLRAVVLSRGLMVEAALDRALDPITMTRSTTPASEVCGPAETTWENEGGHLKSRLSGVTGRKRTPPS